MNAPVKIDEFDSATALRVATEQDFFEILRLCRMLHEENGQHAWSEEKVRLLIWRGVSKDNALIGVIGPSTDIKAMLMLQIDPCSYSDDHQLLEVFNFVRADSRRSDFAKRMVKFAIKCAEETGLELLIGIISNERLEAKQRLYERLLTKSGVWFSHRPASNKVLEDERSSNAG